MKPSENVFTDFFPQLNKVAEVGKSTRTGLSPHIISQMRDIFDQTESAWDQNVKAMHPEIKYLLICEAPPWTFFKAPNYFYLQPLGQLFNAVRKAFFSNTPKDRAKSYDCLAREGFLLIDSLPYAFPFSSNQRKSPEYSDLVKACLPWWLDKLNQSRLSFSPGLKIALGYYRNGLSLIEAAGGVCSINNKIASTVKPGKITIKGNEYTLETSQLVSHVKTGYYPDAEEIRRVYGYSGAKVCN